MQLKRLILLLNPLLFIAPCLFAQVGYTIDIKKSKPYENRVLKSEKTTDKKLKLSKRIFQNATTHYNYFFNANTKIDEVISTAKTGYTDDYSTLLPFYNYTLEATAQSKRELDSVIYKARSGIVLHDLRNDWIDDLYLLWGKAYYLQQKFDSAYQTFQFINHAFADKEKDGYYRFIGSALDGNTALSIATKEKNSFPKTLLSKSPSRNDALLWQARTLIEMNQFNGSGNLITSLKNDLNFPERLKGDLEEVQAYWYYKQQRWDSAAIHLVNIFNNAGSAQEKARWEYLAGQLYEKTGKYEEAQKYYSGVIGHTTDPIMDIYARLNLIRINKTGGDNYIDQNIAQLLKMAKKDRYEDYRDVIYFTAAQMEMARNNPLAAREYILKGASYNNNNITSRTQSYMQLADLLFEQKKYRQAVFFYDSLQTSTLNPPEADRINFRKEVLSRLVIDLNTVERQDSLQRIAKLPEDQRSAYLKKLVKQLRRQQGLREEPATIVPTNNFGNNTANAAPDLFRTEAKGEWYFYNPSLKKEGVATFKQVWGNRPNVDNWRRFSDVSASLRSNNPNVTRDNNVLIPDINLTPSFDVLLGNLPLTPPKLQTSNDSIQNAIYSSGIIYSDELQDYASAVNAFEELRRRFPAFSNMGNVLFQLYYGYTKLGNTAKAAEAKKLLLDTYSASRYASIITKGIDPASSRPTVEVTKTYEHIYDLFIEGSFEEAKAQKQKADSIYHTNYWQPQLLYIEAVYYIKQKQDSTAIKDLNTIISQNTNTALTSKATTLIDVLKRRKQIEAELTALQVEKIMEDTVTKAAPPIVQKQGPIVKKADTAITKPPAVVQAPPVTMPTIKRDTSAVKTKDIVSNKNTGKPILDTAQKKTNLPTTKKSNSIYTYNTEVPHYAMVILNKVDVVFGNEAKNAFNRYNKEKYNSRPLDIQLLNIDADNKLLLIGNFANAQDVMDYVQKAKELAPKEIVPWLKGDKYTFSIISNSNLEVLKANPDLNVYKKFLAQYVSAKF